MPGEDCSKLSIPVDQNGNPVKCHQLTTDIMNLDECKKYAVKYPKGYYICRKNTRNNSSSCNIKGNFGKTRKCKNKYLTDTQVEELNINSRIRLNNTGRKNTESRTKVKTLGLPKTVSKRLSKKLRTKLNYKTKFSKLSPLRELSRENSSRSLAGRIRRKSRRKFRKR